MNWVPFGDREGRAGGWAMVCSISKSEKNEALLLCRKRMRFVKQAIDSRYALSAAHLAYIQSLRSIGIALRRFAEAEVLIESSLSTSEPDKSPSHSSYASPSPSHHVETMGCSPLHNGSPLSPRLSNMSYMRATGSAAVTFRVDSSSSHFVEEDPLSSLLLPPPPPPPLGTGSSWDFFDPVDSIENASGLRNGEHGYSPNFGSSKGFRPFKEDEVVPFDEDEEKWERVGSKGKKDIVCSASLDKMNATAVMANTNSSNIITPERFPDVGQAQVTEGKVNGSAELLAGTASSALHSSKSESALLEKELCGEREDASEFITHRAKDFLSSIKVIEHRFVRAAEHGNEVSRMLEAKKIRLGCCSVKRGRSSTSVFLSNLHLVCCKGATVLDHEPAQHMTKVITWNRSTSSLSSSSKNPLATASKDDICDSGSDFIEEFCMISGSHSSTLDRLYAWERKLYDEVKSSEFVRNEYDQKCSQLRHQFARDLSARVIDKTRAVTKDLHSRVRVAIQTVDSISKRIEKLRDEELQPQLVELIQGLIRMWKAMLECHHAQYITISLAYHVKSSSAASRSDAYRQALIHLQNEIDFFRSSFINWVDSHKAYVESLNSWLQNCIVQPQEPSKGRRAFSPRRALAPPIFVICRDWLAGIKSLPSEELSDAIKNLVIELHDSFKQQVEEKQTEQRQGLPPSDSGLQSDSGLLIKEDEKHEKAPDLGNVQASLTRIFDLLTKFAEASLKVYEDIKQGSETARVAYMNGRRRSVTM